VRRPKIGHIAPSPIPPAEPLAHQVAVPGSGMTPIAFPSPGRYDIANADVLFRPSTMAVSVFQSKSERFENLKDKYLLPGPGSYNPLARFNKRSYQLNLDRHWT
jgi:hypothetical protein